MKTFKRISDGKEFSTILRSHWSDIKADDGEEDYVKWYGCETVDNKTYELYVSNSKGHAYRKIA